MEYSYISKKTNSQTYKKKTCGLSMANVIL